MVGKSQEGKTDVPARELLCRWLESKGYVDVKQTDKFCHWDVEATHPGTKIRYLIELKGRTFASDKYGDTIIEQRKYDFLLPYNTDNEFVFVCNIFTDNKLTLIPLETAHTIVKKVASRTTYFKCHTPEMKTFVSYKNTPENTYDLNL